MKLSIVTTMYYSAPYLNEFYLRMVQAAQAITPDYEIVFVNDGSPDDALAVALNLFERDKRVKVVDFSRNFGHFKAIMTGLAHTTGDVVFLIDCDLEEPPELLGDFWAEMQATPEYDVIAGVQQQRKGSLYEQISGSLYYKITNALSDVKTADNFLTVRLMSRRYVDSLIQHKEQELEISTLMAMTGFNQREVTVKKGHKATSTYTFKKKLDILVNAITSSSSKPLWWVFYLGCIITSIAVGFAALLLFNRFVYHSVPEGWTSIMVALCFFNGLIILTLGVIGIYLSKIFTEVKQRPYTIIRQVYDHEAFPSAAQKPSAQPPRLAETVGAQRG